MSAAKFAATRWTLVLQATAGNEREQALSELCAAYYAPVVAFLRASGRDEDAARDMAHEFFAAVLAGRSLRGADPARGRFRNYLLGAVKHFVADQRDRMLAEKRGGGAEAVPLTGSGAGLVIPAQPPADCERAFDRQWGLTLMARAMETAAGELHEAGKGAQFEALKPWLSAEGGALSQAEAASQLGMSEGAVKVAIHRLRQRFREAVKAEIAQTVPESSDVQDELHHLVLVLAK